MFLLLVKQIILGLSIAAPIGPINIEIIRRGMYQGLWASLLVGAGGMSSDLILMFLMYNGLSDFLTLNWIQIILLIFGTLVLTYTGIHGIVHRSETIDDSSESKDDRKKGLINSYLTGISIAAFNPLNILFWLGVYGSILSNSFQNENIIRAFYINSMIFIGIGLWNVTLALSIHYSKIFLKPTSKMMTVISLTASLVLLGFGFHFAYEAISRLKILL
ncbi:LysE family transporter [Gracilibacillus sp. YIM 98692]|uniref:LysE family transporter n=1 Tax=Gracilibacillus sp. YIM 98692 TaxID=2663532 RepID=UPI0013D5F73E|nr:LysE family transporter [Gracilibacillus sp. YIM 98692]